MKSSKVKVGYLLRVTEKDANYASVEVGEILKVEDSLDPYYDWYGRSEKTNNRWGFDDSLIGNGLEIHSYNIDPKDVLNSYKEEPAITQLTGELTDSSDKNSNGPLYLQMDGLVSLNISRRDIFALITLHSLITGKTTHSMGPDEITDNAVLLTDNLLKKLDKNETT